MCSDSALGTVAKTGYKYFIYWLFFVDFALDLEVSKMKNENSLSHKCPRDPKQSEVGAKETMQWIMMKINTIIIFTWAKWECVWGKV